jgi:hypothetical protein
MARGKVRQLFDKIKRRKSRMHMLNGGIIFPVNTFLMVDEGFPWLHRGTTTNRKADGSMITVKVHVVECLKVRTRPGTAHIVNHNLASTPVLPGPSPTGRSVVSAKLGKRTVPCEVPFSREGEDEAPSLFKEVSRAKGACDACTYRELGI